MNFIKWWGRSDRRLQSSKRDRGRRPRLWGYRCRLTLEELEARTVPSFFAVTSDADPITLTVGTLRYAVNYLNTHGGGILNLEHNVLGHTIRLAQGELLVSQNLKVLGPGADEL